MSTRIHRLIESILNEATKGQTDAIKNLKKRKKEQGESAAYHIAASKKPGNKPGVSGVHKINANANIKAGKDSKGLMRGIINRATGK